MMTVVERPFILNLTFMGVIPEHTAIEIAVFVNDNIRAVRIIENPIGREFIIPFRISISDYQNGRYKYLGNRNRLRDVSGGDTWDERVSVRVELWVAKIDPYKPMKFNKVRLLGEKTRNIKISCPSCIVD
jgi:hypothetical protein